MQWKILKDSVQIEAFKIQVPPPPPLSQGVAKAGRNHLNEEFKPLLPTGIGERYSQTISNFGHAWCSALAPMWTPLLRGGKCWTNSGGPLVNSLLWVHHREISYTGGKLTLCWSRSSLSEPGSPCEPPPSASTTSPPFYCYSSEIGRGGQRGRLPTPGFGAACRNSGGLRVAALL